MAGSELLIRHAAKWAEKRSAPLDADLLETALELRSLHDGLTANRWPEGSVEHLMLERWPAHGPSGAPDVAALVATLESFWKFLSNTGRMARGSADPRILRAEARRAEPEMVEATGAVPGGWGMPAEPRLDEDEDLAFPSDPELAAPHWLGSAYCRSLAAFAQWVGDGREVTAAGLLRPAVAREAYRELDLWEWERGWWRIGHGEVPDPETDEILREVAVTSWRSAGDCLALDRLWNPLVAAGLVQLGSKRVVAARTVPTAPASDAVHFGLLALSHLVVSLREGLDTTCLAHVVFFIAFAGDQPPTRTDLTEAWWASPANPLPTPELSDDSERILRRLSDHTVLQCLEIFGDCGLWVEDGGVLVGTEFGWDFALIMTRLLESGILD
ncbi:MAG: hypothetical protein ACQERF_10770 [Actinomycetota bacterium]